MIIVKCNINYAGISNDLDMPNYIEYAIIDYNKISKILLCTFCIGISGGILLDHITGVDPAHSISAGICGISLSLLVYARLIYKHYEMM